MQWRWLCREAGVESDTPPDLHRREKSCLASKRNDLVWYTPTMTTTTTARRKTIKEISKTDSVPATDSVSVGGLEKQQPQQGKRKSGRAGGRELPSVLRESEGSRPRGLCVPMRYREKEGMVE